MEFQNAKNGLNYLYLSALFELIGIACGSVVILARDWANWQVVVAGILAVACVVFVLASVVWAFRGLRLAAKDQKMFIWALLLIIALAVIEVVALILYFVLGSTGAGQNAYSYFAIVVWVISAAIANVVCTASGKIFKAQNNELYQKLSKIAAIACAVFAIIAFIPQLLVTVGAFPVQSRWNPGFVLLSAVLGLIANVIYFIFVEEARKKI